MTDILLADDSVTIQRVVELTFAGQGLKVVSVSDGHQALEYLSTERPAVALVSATLPKVNGFDVARAVRNRANLRELPVLLLAGAFDTIDETDAREAGAAGVLFKPLEPGLVIKRVKDLLGISSNPSDERRDGSATRRLVTSGEAPARASRDSETLGSAGAPPLRADSPAESGLSAVDALAAASSSRSNGVPAQSDSGHTRSWNALQGGAEPPAHAMAGGSAETDDYLGKLDEAFASLQARLAGPSAAAPAPLAEAGLPQPLEPGSTASTNIEQQTAATAPAEKPVFEIDEEWFREADAGVTGAARATQPPAPAEPANEAGRWNPYAPGPSAGSLPPPQEHDYISPISADARTSDVPPSNREEAPSNQGAPSLSENVTGPAAHQVSLDALEPRELFAAREERAADSHPDSLAPAAGALAMLATGDQGERLQSPPPVELSETTIETVAQRVTAALAPRVTDDLASGVTDELVRRLTIDLAHRLGDPLAERVTAGVAERTTNVVADRLTEALPGPISSALGARLGLDVSAAVADRVTDALPAPVISGVADRVTAGLATRLANDLGAPLTNGLADRLAADLAGRVVDGLASRLSDEMSNRISAVVTERLSNAVMPQLSRFAEQMTADAAQRVGERLSSEMTQRLTAASDEMSGRLTAASEQLSQELAGGLAEQVASHVTERMLHSAFGEGLRQSVHDVAERLVREEIARIRSAVRESRA